MIGLLKRPRPGDAAQLEKRLGHAFGDPGLLRRALTHSSFAYEKGEDGVDNELLEFLGDSVIGLVAADFFFAAATGSSEGDLSKLKSSVCSTIALAEFAADIRLDRYLLLGKGEEKSGGRKKGTILAGAFEAVVGALYLGGGYEAARAFFRPFLEASYKKIRREGAVLNNYKSALQEYLQKENLPAPQYRTLTTVGPDHRREFVVEVYVNRTPLAKARGPSRKAAEQKAAEKALKSFFGRRIKALTAETFVYKG